MNKSETNKVNIRVIKTDEIKLSPMEEAEEIDEMLRVLPLANGFIDVNHPNISDQFRNFHKYKYKLHSEGLIDYQKGKSEDNFYLRAWLTPKGNDFISQGGFVKQQMKIERDEKNKIERDEWEREIKLKELKQNNISNIMTGGALVISIISLIWTILTYSSNNNLERNLNTRIDSLKSEIIKINSLKVSSTTVFQKDSTTNIEKK